MANAKIGSNAGWSGNYAESLDSDRILTPSDSGKIFFLDASATFLISLPKLSSKIAGWHADFMITTAGSGTVSILAYGLPVAGGTVATYADSDAETVTYNEWSAGDGAAGDRKTGDDGVAFSTSCLTGDYMTIRTTGSEWFVSAFVDVIAGGVGIDAD